jgi:hypothetical protein
MAMSEAATTAHTAVSITPNTIMTAATAGPSTAAIIPPIAAMVPPIM